MWIFERVLMGFATDGGEGTTHLMNMLRNGRSLKHRRKLYSDEDSATIKKTLRDKDKEVAKIAAFLLKHSR